MSIKKLVLLLTFALVLKPLPSHASFSATPLVNWDIEPTGNDTNNGGGFDGSVVAFPTDGAATLATSSAPVFTSASYTFVAGDVNAWLYIKSGTNWTPGFYKIASVSAGAATLSAAAGAGFLAPGGNLAPVTLVAGIATVASPTVGTWGIDYSQSSTAQIAFTDMVIDATTNTKFTSVAHPVGKNFIGNVIAVTSGTGFTVQRVAVVSTTGTVATCDKSLGTLSSTGGNGGLGGAFLTITTALTVVASGNVMHLKTSTYTQTVHLDGTLNPVLWTIRGYNTVHGDGGTKPLVTTATNSTHLWDIGGGAAVWTFDNISMSNTAATRSYGVTAFGGGATLYMRNCLLDGFLYPINGENSTWNAFGTVYLFNTEIKNSTLQGVFNQNPIFVILCNIHDNVGAGIYNTGSSNLTEVIQSQLTTNTYGIRLDFSTAQPRFFNDTIANNTNHGVFVGAGGVDLLNSMIVNNIIYGNGGNGIFQNSVPTNTGAQTFINRNNAYGSNTSGDVNNFTKDPSDLAITANPFTNSAGGDFTLNNTTGGGKLVKGAGVNGVDLGALQTVCSGGGAFACGFSQLQQPRDLDLYKGDLHGSSYR